MTATALPTPRGRAVASFLNHLPRPELAQQENVMHATLTRTRPATPATRIPTQRARSRYARRRPWWVASPDRELVAFVQLLGHRARLTLGYTLVFALVYFGTNHGLG